jgi:MFS family permease
VIPAPLRSCPDFLRLWWSRLASVSAGQMLMVAIGWEVYDLTGSAWDLGLVGLLQFAPALVLMLPAGHVVDRFHRATIVSCCLAAQGAVAAVLWLSPFEGLSQRTLLLGASLVLGAVKAFQMPAQQALVPLLVPSELLARALAFSSAGLQAAIIAGPALGGFLYVGGSDAVQAACVLLFAVAAALASQVRHAPPARSEPASLHTLLAGVRYVRSTPVVLGAISLDLFAVLLGGATALLPIFAKDILHVGPIGMGWLRAAPAIGALLVSLALSRWPIERGAGTKLYAAIVVYGLATLAFGLSTSFVLSMVALATPDAMRGRVSAVNSVFIGASNQLGEFESGATAAWLGPVGSVVLGGLGSIAVAALWWHAFPALARRDHLAAPQASASPPQAASSG